MLYPTLGVQNSMREIVDSFGGYNHNLRIGDGEFYEMKNMSSDGYPVLMPRGKRGWYAEVANPESCCMIAKDDLCYVDGSDIVIGDERVNLELNTWKQKRLVSMGAYIIIMPDKKYINTVDTGDYGDIEWTNVIEPDENGVSYVISPCDKGANNEDLPHIGSNEPENASDNDLWIDTKDDEDGPTLKKYNEKTQTWYSVTNSYVRIGATGIGINFSEGDAVILSMDEFEGSHIIQECADDYIVISGNTEIDVLVRDSMARKPSVSRSMPDMDFIIEAGNRLWGCRYGTNNAGEFVNEIYASKLGDFKNWNYFGGISMDSYKASCGTDGPFTGAVTYLGHPMFFKESCIHKIYGSYPAQFQIQTTECRGVQHGCNKSLAIVNETLLYKSRDAICAYDGSLPVEISYNLGRVLSKDAVAGAYDSKYYISNKDPQGHIRLYVYDMEKALWHIEDEFYPVDYCTHNGILYAVDQKTKRILTMGGEGDPAEDTVEWYVETGEIGIASPDMKYLTNLLVRMSMDVGSEVWIHTKHDFEEEWELAYALSTSSLRSFSIPIRPKRCDHLKLRIEGRGMAKIYSITKTIEQGSDRS